jgi:hypothetical protein
MTLLGFGSSTLTRRAAIPTAREDRRSTGEERLDGLVSTKRSRGILPVSTPFGMTISNSAEAVSGVVVDCMTMGG